MSYTTTAFDKLTLIKNWLDYQHLSFVYGIRTIQDAEKLWDYAREHDDTLAEFPDSWEVETVLEALGYNPWKEPVNR